jgi:hypothetical protein
MASPDEAREVNEDGSIIPDILAHNLELAATIVLAIAAVLTAWTAFQSSKWGGVQATSFSEAGANRTESTRFSTLAGQQAQVDISTFTNWLNAVQADSRAGDIQLPSNAADYQPDPETLSGFLFLRFRDEFKPAVNSWLQTKPFTDLNAPPSPLDMPEYELAARDTAEELQGGADEASQKARDANQTSDDYVISAVLAALVLFFAGVSSKLIRPRNRVFVLILALVVLIGTAIRVFSLPIEL